jgi:RimJ/RimL family protein N-acetyltransferase
MSCKLEGKNIYLRFLELNDANGDYPNWLNDPIVTKYNSHGKVHYTKEMATEYITKVSSDNSIQAFAIVQKNNDEHIGNIALQQIDLQNKKAEFAILIGKTNTYAKGIGFECSSLLLNYGFKTLNLNTIYCGTSADNVPMQKLAKKLGFQVTNIQKNAMEKNGKMVDVINYVLNKEDYYEKM